jgi:hypothetical protein
MPATPCRRFTLLDAVVLVGATGVSLMVANLRFLPMLAIKLSSAATHRSGGHALAALAERLPELGPLLVIYAPVLLALRLRRPRPPLRRLAVQPGFTACAAIALVYAAGGLLHSVGQSLESRYANPAAVKVTSLVWVWNILYTHQLAGGYAVSAAWLVLIVGRRWRPEASWIDRAGRALGLIFVALVPLLTLWSHWLR